MNRLAGPVLFLLLLCSLDKACSQSKNFKVIAFFTPTVERDHVDFANDAIHYFQVLGKRRNFAFDTTSNWASMTSEMLSRYAVVMWINEFPQTENERRAFEGYMDHGGAWMGFHVSAYNDRYTQWPWFVDFLGGAVFYTNNWPPLAADLVVDEPDHPVTKGLPPRFRSPINEWYQWKPSPRLNKDVNVLLTLAPSNYPIGKKDIIQGGDTPVVWTNTRYRMVYLNMGHGDQVLTDDIQNSLFENTILWLGRK